MGCLWSPRPKLRPSGQLETTGPCRGESFTREGYEVGQSSSGTNSHRVLTGALQVPAGRHDVAGPARVLTAVALVFFLNISSRLCLPPPRLTDVRQSLKSSHITSYSRVDRGAEQVLLHRNASPAWKDVSATEN